MARLPQCHFLTKIADARKLSDKIQKKGGKALVGVHENLVDIVWGKGRPPRPNEPVKVLSVEFAGKKFEEKLEDLRKELEKKKSPGFIVCTFCSLLRG
jgi:Xaa-Pro aminopeptidase